MTKFTKVLAVLVILSFVCANAQADIEDNAAQGDFGDDGQFQHTNDEQETTIQRNKLIACIVLSRHKFNDINNELSATLRQHPNSQSLYKKMLGDFMLKCFFSISVEESEKFFEVIQNKQLDLDEWEHLHDFNLANYKDTTELDLSPEQERLVELVEEFDKQMKDKYGDQSGTADDSDEDYYAKKNIDIEPKIGGISLKNTGSSVKLAYVAIIVAIIGGGLFFALKKLFTPELTPYEKIKIQKQERKKVSQSPTKKQQ